MTFNLGVELAQLVISLLAILLKGNPTDIENAILAVVRKGYEVYIAQTGKPIDPSLIQPIPPIQ